MSKILKKEMKLSASFLSYLFIVFGLMFLLPGYPVLCGAFFVTLGIFQSFQNAREANDIIYSALLPVAKSDVVKGKFIFSCFIELCSLILMAAAMLFRMTAKVDSPVYRANALMNANLFALGLALVIFGLFNLIFIGGFFRTAYKFAKPFAVYIFITFALIGISEALHYVPGLDGLNAFGFDKIKLQAGLFIAGAAVSVVMTLVSYRCSCRNFEKIDL